MFHVPAHLSSFIEANVYRTTTRLMRQKSSKQLENLCVAVALE